jgi:hypothetical protein
VTNFLRKIEKRVAIVSAAEALSKTNSFLTARLIVSSHLSGTDRNIWVPLWSGTEVGKGKVWALLANALDKLSKNQTAENCSIPETKPEEGAFSTIVFKGPKMSQAPIPKWGPDEGLNHPIRPNAASSTSLSAQTQGQYLSFSKRLEYLLPLIDCYIHPKTESVLEDATLIAP